MNAHTTLTLRVVSDGETDYTDATRMLEDAGFDVLPTEGDVFAMTARVSLGYDDTLALLDRMVSPNLGGIELTGDVETVSPA